jgi:hypothetical protein
MVYGPEYGLSANLEHKEGFLLIWKSSCPMRGAVAATLEDEKDLNSLTGLADGHHDLEEH